jgi:hypothetical protein
MSEEAVSVRDFYADEFGWRMEPTRVRRPTWSLTLDRRGDPRGLAITETETRRRTLAPERSSGVARIDARRKKTIDCRDKGCNSTLSG